MALSGTAKAEYQRKEEAGSQYRLLVGDQDCIICEVCITLAVARIAEARGR